jgi:hypothetical protein
MAGVARRPAHFVTRARLFNGLGAPLRNFEAFASPLRVDAGAWLDEKTFHIIILSYNSKPMH